LAHQQKLGKVYRLIKLLKMCHIVARQFAAIFGKIIALFNCFAY